LPKKDVVFDAKGAIESVVINPKRFVEVAVRDFSAYLEALRKGTDKD
jgi:hypothetical protein